METCTAKLREMDGTWLQCTHPAGHDPIRWGDDRNRVTWDHEHEYADATGSARGWNDTNPADDLKECPVAERQALAGQPDPELAAIRQVFEALSVLEEHEQRSRVVRWAADRFNVTAWH